MTAYPSHLVSISNRFLLCLLLATGAHGFSGRLSGRIWQTRTVESSSARSSPVTTTLSLLSPDTTYTRRKAVTATTRILSSSDSTSATPADRPRRHRHQQEQQLVSSAASAAICLRSRLNWMQSSFDRSLYKFLRRFWWSFPLILCLVPFYTSVFYKTTPATPDWWKLINLENSDASHSFLTMFLCSNVSYLLGGLYLLKQYPLLKSKRQRGQLQHNDPQKESQLLMQRLSSRAASLPLVQPSWGWGVLLSLSRNTYVRVPSRGTWLSLWMLLAGFVSTLFHAVQAYGSYGIAEGWCYLDHGIAIAATMYFMEYCKAPELPTLSVGILGMLALALPRSSNHYLWLHSAWHFLSAGAAVMWASQRQARRRAQLERSLVCVRARQHLQQ